GVRGRGGRARRPRGRLFPVRSGRCICSSGWPVPRGPPASFVDRGADGGAARRAAAVRSDEAAAYRRRTSAGTQAVVYRTAVVTRTIDRGHESMILPSIEGNGLTRHVRTDAELLGDICADKADALECLFHRYVRLVHGVA